VTAVLLESGERLAADLVVLGLGVAPNTALVRHLGHSLNMDDKGSILVDEHMATSLPNIWAAGDIVLFPLLPYGRSMIHIGHFAMAATMGRVAALNILGRGVAMRSVPFYWTVHYGRSVRIVGHGTTAADSVEVEQGEDGGFVAVYSGQDGLVTAVVTYQRDPVGAHFANLVQTGQKLAKTTAFQYFKNVAH
jgi:NADPH-dependent 2,4-dienoyl-CoA reductase/sulfur reductase-like enzyme